MKGVARDAFQYWTQMTCLEWKEGCATKPPIKIFKGDGCYTLKGRKTFLQEQQMSLQEPGCEFFATVAHEASHVMGMAHEQSRPDRDQFIDVVWTNIEEDWKSQYDKADDSNTFNLVYDYGSNMQYTG
ncbi:NAS-31 protein, partial [Aphelenchoides avenae]